MKTTKHCRYCNRTLEPEATRCPACKQTQSRLKEYIALALAALVLCAVAYFQLLHAPTVRPESPQPRPPVQTAGADSPGAPHSASSRALPDDPLAKQRSPLTVQPPKPRRTGTPGAHTPVAGKTVHYQGTAFRQEHGDFPYYVAEKQWHSSRKEYEFLRKGMHGSEISLKVDARRYFLSENQNDYPEPESGCGPTALLNLYVWYTKFGLLKESVRHSNPETYKRLKFQQIDRKLLSIQRASRSWNGGTNTLAAIVAMDELVQEFSHNSTRLHFEIKKPPLKRRDFTKLSQGYRAGILSVRPKDPETGQLMGNHAVLCIRGDTAGMITIANWGKFSHGSLVQRNDGQWFVPRDPSQHELRINNLTTLIPIVPREGSSS